MFGEEEVARHSYQKVAHYLDDVDSSEYFIYSFLGGISEVFGQGEHQMMSHIAKHERGKSLNLLQKDVEAALGVTAEFGPGEVAPRNLADSMIIILSFNLFLFNRNGKTNEKGQQ